MSEGRAATEIWFRNAGDYVIQLAEVGANNVVFDYAYAAKRNIRPLAYLQLYFGIGIPWRCIIIHPDRSILYDNESVFPLAVWPTFSCRYQSIDTLRKMIDKPITSINQAVFKDLEITEQPVEDQNHVIVISDLPNMSQGPGKAYLDSLSVIQEENPQVTLFIHGTYSYRPISLGFKMMDLEPRQLASLGMIYHPGGGPLSPESMKGNEYWAEILGYNLADLKDPKNRCKYNIKSGIFAGSYFNKLKRFALPKGKTRLDWNTPQMEAHLKESSTVFTKRLVHRPGDRLVCDDCSLWLTCKYYREGAVCAVPDSEMKQVSELFGTRDSRSIINGLTKLTQLNLERIDRAQKLEASPKTVDRETGESEEREVDPALTKLIADTFKMGHEILKIVDPTQRAGKPGVNVNVAGGAQRVEITAGGATEAQETISYVYSILESRGYSRDQITPDLIEQTVRELAGAELQTIPGQLES